MKITVLLAALCAVVFASNADARPRHHIVDANNMVGCSDPVMRPCVEMTSVLPTSSAARARAQKARRIPPGLSRVMTEGAGRVVNWAKPRAWCGWWMRRHLGVADPAGNLASWWAGYGSPAHGPHVGAIVVWRHHVGRITGRTADGRWIVRSGNDGHRVRERPRSVADAIAFRWPV